MLPSFLSGEIINGIKQYLIEGWEPSNRHFHGLIRKYCETEGKLYKGPYISIGLPFLKSMVKKDYFENFKTRFIPFNHQIKAWERILGEKSTIIATGTGSGKTECFFYPILEYCANNTNRGIKAIIIYPMNALANDQAKRIAEFIYNENGLRGKIRAGLFIGGYENSASGTDRMSRDSVITKKDTLRNNPPDILMTNYKMLDYMLIRPEDRPLWENSKARFLVVDELHTFDGAQGTDLALLIRRLKARLDTDSLICVGTSATLGGDEDRDALLDYAGDVFNTSFDGDAIVGEERESTDEFLAKSPIEYLFDSSGHIDRAESLKDGIEKWYRLFFNEDAGDVEHMQWRAELGKKLKRQLQFYNLLRSLDGKIKDADIVSEDLAKTLPEISKKYSRDILNALVGLCSWARNEEFNSLPFVQVRYQIWARELRRMLCRVTGDRDNIGLISADDRDMENYIYLPLVQCLECHTTGWLGRIPEGDNKVDSDILKIYNSFFSSHPDTALLFPDLEEENLQVKGMTINICGSCGGVNTGATRICPACGSEDTVRVFRVAEIESRSTSTGATYRVAKKICPVCGSEDKLLLIGARSATLSSVAIAHLWASKLNDDKKLIAFSDSVQDAAHRAGFFSARTYSNNVRMAIAQALGNKRGWNELLEHISIYWRDILGDERFVSEFIGPNMVHCDDYNDFIKTGKISNDLINMVKKRLKWEIFAEFTYASERGRTLERTGLAAMSIRKEAVDDAMDDIHEAVREGFRIGDRDEHEVFVWGILYHMKSRGGVYHNFFKTYMETNAHFYVLNRLPFAPNFGKKSLRPVFLRTSRKKYFENYNSPWYRNWVRKCFRNYTLPSNIENEIYPAVMKILAERSILMINNDVYSLNPENLYVTNDIIMVTNQYGTSGFAIPSIMEGVFVRMPVLEQGASGKYKKAENKEQWLKDVYKRGQIRRVISAEHTGLLEKKEREDLEKRFNSGADSKPWYENLLSATPTLEMGIDIGDLSSVLLCQVPPSQANYLQRVGRAGRRDGNSIALTIATGKPHDLYFYSMPEAMFLGRVNPPGVFLNASMVLFRQLIAFCLDRWVSEGIHKSEIPEKLRYVLDNVEKNKKDKFPYNFIDFIKINKQDLFASFIGFLPDISQRAKDALEIFLFGNNTKKYFEYYLLERLVSLSEERKRFRSQAEMLKSEISKLSSKTQDDYTEKEIETYRREKDSLLGIIARINNKHTLNFMTDEGLLPNYAFPETGVILRSVIWRRKGDKKVFEYERSASTALSEFAPENIFYATGHKIEVEQIDMKISKIEEWRFCPSCSYLENIRETGDRHKECPNCGDPQWADLGQKMKLVRLRQVMARSEDRASSIGDDTEDREPVFYTRHLLPVFGKNDIEKAYFIKDEYIPFGFEFIKNVVLREVNFGKYGDNSRPSTRVAGKDAVRPGFTICRYCGKVQKLHDKEFKHAFRCEAENGQKDDAMVDCLYLYREFESEAIRIAIPSTRFASDDKALHSMIASLQLGLKLKYKGKIDHLKITSYEERDRTGCQRSYILLYDSVPGGTGYLHDLLSDSDSLMGVLELARDRMMSCKCAQDPEKDGCYECLYAYRLSHGMEKTSRRTAISLLTEILDRKNNLKSVESISECISTNPLVESELEAMFITALKIMAAAGTIKSFHPEIVSGRPGYFIQAGDYSYLLEPQVELGTRDGVSVPCRPDFVIRSMKSSLNVRPVAVFLDGFEYHKDRIDDDALKRTAVVKSGNYFVWNLTWDDVISITDSRIDQIKESYFSDSMNAGSGGNEPIFRKMAERLGAGYIYNMLDCRQMYLLVHYLNSPAKNEWENAVFIKAASLLDSTYYNTADIDTGYFPRPVQDIIKKENRYFYKIDKKLLSSCLIMSPLALHEKDAKKIYFAEVLDTSGDADKESWRQYLEWINRYQFLKYAFWTTTDNLRSADYDQIILQYLQEIPVAEYPEWHEIIDEAFEEMNDSLEQLQKDKVPIPVICYEMMENNAVIAEAELAWTDIKAAVLREDQRNMRSIFESRGWKVFDSSEKWHEYINNYYEE